MATQEEKDLKKQAKAQAKIEKEQEKQEAKEAREQVKAEAKLKKKLKNEEKKVENLRVKRLLDRAKAERGPAKKAAKAIAKERNRPLALKKIDQVRKNFMGLPPALWPFTIVVAYIWAKNTWEKERQIRDLKEARRFLKETSDIRRGRRRLR